MLISRIAVGMAAVAMMALGADMACGQDYPNRPIRIYTASAGGSADFASRLIARGISGPLGQTVIVENRGGGTPQIEIVAKAAPDGYTLLVQGNSVWITPFLQKTSYDTLRDLSPITLVDSAPIVLVVTPSLPAKSVKELIALTKARPGELNAATPGSRGSTSHLAMELFKSMARINIVGVPYKSSSTQMTDLITGQVQMTFDTGATLLPHLKSGKLRPLAITSAKPSALFRDLPTVGATLPGYEFIAVTGVFAPVKTPAAVINRLNQEIVRFLNTTEAKEIYSNVGVDAVTSSPEEFTATIKADMARTGKLITDLGIKVD